MSRRKKNRTVSVAAPLSAPAKPAPTDFHSGLVGMLTAVIVATVLVPSEAVTIAGVNAPLNMLLLVILAAYLLAVTQDAAFSLRCGPADGVAAALIGWHLVSFYANLDQGNNRGGINLCWQWLAYGGAAFLARQLLRSAERQRAFVAVMLALAVMVAAHGFYQWGVTFPEMRAGGEKQAVQQGYQPGTPEFDLFMARLRSPEPLARFALTNSLAGFLAPWIVVGVAVTFSAARFGWRTMLGCAPLILLVGCLLLCRSRTGVLATIVGLGCLALFYVLQRAPDEKRRTALLAPIGGVILALVAGGIGLAALDADVWSGAPASVRYRFEYWQATLRMIADHPTFGVGPGNFQDVYAKYKLPQASEMVADPHNFLLEVAAGAGIPALILLVLLIALVARQAATAQEPTEKPTASKVPQWLAIYLGGLIGAVVAWPASILVGYSPDTIALSPALSLPDYLVVGLPVAGVVLFGLQPWVARGSLSPAVIAAAAITLLVNLLAAGSVTFPGVFLPAWIFAALLLNSSANDSPVTVSGRIGGAVLVATLVLGGCCFVTCYRPNVIVRNKINEGDMFFFTLGRLERAEAAYREATETDPWSAEAVRAFANLLWEQNRLQPSKEIEEFANRATDRYTALAPRSYRAHLEAGDHRLRAYRYSGRDSWLDEALRSYEQARERYPNGAFVHAQSAWAYHLKRDDVAAKREAKLALELDDKHEHSEQKLKNRRLADVPKAMTKTDEPPPDESAREIMERLAADEAKAVEPKPVAAEPKRETAE